MTRSGLFAVSAVFALAGCGPATNDRLEMEDGGDDDRIATVTGTDAEMNAAIAWAQRTLPEFERRLASPPAAQSYIGIKAAFDYGDNDAEHMWIKNIAVVEGGYEGTLVSAPQYVHSLEAGQQVFVRREQVSDWLAIDDGVLVAGYTMRVIRKRLSPEEQREFDAMVGYRIVD
jgi:uncharacterized protein YegJ (DUF2314 family)